MRLRLLEVLRCPRCEGRFAAAVPEMRGDHAWTGELRCGSCARGWPIVRGVPRFVESGDPLFERQWERYADFDTALSRDALSDWLGIAPADLAGAMILDLGCGTGGLAAAAAGEGARLVIGLDATGAVEGALGRSFDRENLEFVQADLLEPPFERSRFDIVYSVGVMHHLADPSLGVQRASELVRTDGLLAIWVYGRDGTLLVRTIRQGLRRWLTMGTSERMRARTAELLAAVVTLVALLVDRLPGAVKGRLAFGAYLGYFRVQPQRRRAAIVYDHLSARIAHYSESTVVRSWLQDAGLADVRVDPRYRIGWRARGRRRAS